MMIIRTVHKTDFTQLPNAIARNEALSCEAFGMLAYLLTKPRNWNVNVRQLMAWSGYGENKVRQILNVIIGAGYARRTQSKIPGSNRYGPVEYWVFDVAQDGTKKPLDDFSGAANEQENDGSEKLAEISQSEPRDDLSVAESRDTQTGRHSKNITTNSPTERENSGSDEPGDKSQLAVKTKEVWDVVKPLLLRQNPNPKQVGSLIGQWQQRTPSIEDKDKLLAMAAAATANGTPQPIEYISKGMNQAYPRKPKPNTFSREKWESIANAAIDQIATAKRIGRTPDLTKSWSNSMGPLPGKPKCSMPKDLQDKIQIALDERKAA